MHKKAMRECEKATLALKSNAETVFEFCADLNAADLPDVGAELKRARDALDAADKAVKARILAETDGDTMQGSAYRARIVETVRWTLDTKTIKEEMGEDWTTARSKCNTVRSVRYAV